MSQQWTGVGTAGNPALLDADGVLPLAQNNPGVSRWTKYRLTISGANFLVNGAGSVAKAGATTQSVALFTKAANTVIEAVVLKPSTQFAGTSISALTGSLGVAGDVAGITTAFDILQAPSATAFTESAKSSITMASVGVVLALAATGANLSALTAGVLDVWVKTSVLPS